MYVPVGAATTRRTAKTITDLVKTHPGLGQDVFVHEHDYNQAMNELVALRADYADLCKRLDALPSAIAPSDSVCVPRIKYIELLDCCEDMATGKGGWAWEDVLDEHHTLLAAAPPSAIEPKIGDATGTARNVICHAPGAKCLGCAHYEGKADHCLYTPRMEVGAIDTSEVLATHSGGDRREWHSQGTWLYAGDSIVVKRSDKNSERSNG